MQTPSSPDALPGLRINRARLLARLDALGRVGALPGGGVSRLALTDEDRRGRGLVIQWMRELGLRVTIDAIGNVVGLRPGAEPLAPVMTGSHIDTVRAAGIFDGNLGVLAGLEVVETLNEARVATRRPLAVAFFTNEEGARFPPDMMGSLVYVGGMPLAQALATKGIDGLTVGECLKRGALAGSAPCGDPEVHAFVELHIEQGPKLEREGLTIGAVDGVQGISWTEYTLTGSPNHAGTTPMSLRRDAGYVVANVTCYVRELARELGGAQVATVGAINLKPNLVNVVPGAAVFTVDLRNTDEQRLQEAERLVDARVRAVAAAEDVTVARRTLSRFAPVRFDPAIVARVERAARELGHPCTRMPSGAGHDAQMLARVCPAGMIFVPSEGGISHNIRERTAPADLEAGANVLLRVLVELASG